jgi:hypothetical protein
MLSRATEADHYRACGRASGPPRGRRADRAAFSAAAPSRQPCSEAGHESHMNQIIYIVGLVVIVLFILGYFGLR